MLESAAKAFLPLQACESVFPGKPSRWANYIGGGPLFGNHSSFVLEQIDLYLFCQQEISTAENFQADVLLYAFSSHGEL